MLRHCILAVLALFLAGCASTSQITRDCNAARGDDRRAWTQLATAPENAAAYRALASADRRGYSPPRGYQREFWFSAADATRLCVLDIRLGRGLCSGGNWDFQNTADGPVYQDGGEWICVS